MLVFEGVDLVVYLSGLRFSICSLLLVVVIPLQVFQPTYLQWLLVFKESSCRRQNQVGYNIPFNHKRQMWRLLCCRVLLVKGSHCVVKLVNLNF